MKKTSAEVAEKTNESPELFPVTQIEVALIDPSPVNKRIFIDNDPKLKELSESIGAQGLLQAIVVRLSPTKKGRYELVAGERRWRAFKIGGWKLIPAVVRELTDNEAHDITTLENLQREDLSPIEEAESIQVLLEDGRDPKEIADRIGKPVSWVLRRARIADLSPVWIKAISDPKNELSKWSATHLELIARYDHETQDEMITGFDTYNTAIMTVKDLEKRLNGKMLTLSVAPWKLTDETFYPKSVACSMCQKRTSCAPSLFEPIEDTKVPKGDRCLDRACWGDKLLAFHELNIKKEREQHASLVLVNRANYDARTLPKDNSLAMLKDEWMYEPAKKDDKKAIPAYIVDGPGAGKVQYVKLRKEYESSKKSQPATENGKPAEKPIEERREGLQKRRIIRFINKLILILKNEDPYQTGDKDRENVKKTTDFRIEIAEKLSNFEAFALICAFGASRFNEEEDDPEWDRWKVYRNVAALTEKSAQIDALFGAFDRIVDALRQEANSPHSATIDFPDSLCAALKLDRDHIWKSVLAEIPEPKSWAKLDGDKE